MWTVVISTSSARIPSFVTEAEITPPPKRYRPGRLKMVSISYLQFKYATSHIVLSAFVQPNLQFIFFKCPRPAPSSFWAAFLACTNISFTLLVANVSNLTIAKELRTKLDLITEPKRAIAATVWRRLLWKRWLQLFPQIYCASSITELEYCTYFVQVLRNYHND